MLTHQVSDATGSMTTTKVSDKSPFLQELLIRDDCFILDNGSNGKIFVWKGEELATQTRSGKLATSSNLISDEMKL